MGPVPLVRHAFLSVWSVLAVAGAQLPEPGACCLVAKLLIPVRGKLTPYVPFNSDGSQIVGDPWDCQLPP